jgi:hypothetical protein
VSTATTIRECHIRAILLRVRHDLARVERDRQLSQSCIDGTTFDKVHPGWSKRTGMIIACDYRLRRRRTGASL